MAMTGENGPLIFGQPSKSIVDHDRWVAQEALKTKQRRQKRRERKKRAGYWDEETVEAWQDNNPRPNRRPTMKLRMRAYSTTAKGPSRHGDSASVITRGLCERDYKRWRRSQGKTN